MYLALGTVGKLQNTVLEGKEGVVRTATHIVTRVDVRATLTYDDIASGDLLAGKAFDTEAFCLGVTTVSG